MLQFNGIIVTKEIDAESIENLEMPIPKAFTLLYSDDELHEGLISEVLGTISNHDFTINNEQIIFSMSCENNNLGIAMEIVYADPVSANRPDLSLTEVITLYRHAFEDFYNKNKPY